MSDAAFTLLLVACSGLAVWGMWRLAEWADSRLTPEQRKEIEHERWRHS